MSLDAIREIINGSNLSADAGETLLGIVQAMTLDELTGLPVRSHYRDELRRVQAILRRANFEGASGPRFAILLFDVNGLKKVNDTEGHLAGDSLLMDATMNLVSVLRPTDRLYRVGGDEFIALVELNGIHETGAHVLGRIADRYTGPSLSAGVADTSKTENLGNVESVADTNMYAAKKSQSDDPKGNFYFIKG